MRAQDRAITGLTTIGHALVHTYELSIPILMTVWMRELGASTAELGVAVSIGYALFGLGALPGGILTDRFGSKRLIAACLLGMGGAFVLLSLAQGLVLITGALAVWGAAASVYHPAGLTLISKGTSERGRVFAYHGMAGNLGIALGPLAATVLLLFFDWRVVCVVLAVPGLAVLPVVRRLHVQEHEPDGDPATSEAVSQEGSRTS
ncbi:MAG: MFS transporter, partial [Rhodothermales bacterium]